MNANTILNQLNEAIWTVNSKTGVYTYLNEAQVVSVFGFSLQEMLEDETKWLYKVERIQQERLKAYRLGKFDGLEISLSYYYDHPQKGLIRLIENLKKVETEEGNVVLCRCSQLNYKANPINFNPNLPNSLNSYIQLAHHFGDATIVLNRFNSIVHLNTIAESILGYKLSDLDPNHSQLNDVGSIYEEKDGVDIKLELKSILKTIWLRNGSGMPYRIKIKTHQGKTYYLTTNSILSTNEELQETFALIVLRDITKEVNLTSEMQKRAEQFRLIFENSPAGIAFYDNNGTILEVNEELCRIMGAPRTSIIGLNMVSQLKNKAIIQQVKKSLTGYFGLYEGSYTSVSGKRTAFVRAYFNPILGLKNEVIGGVLLADDLSESQKNKEEIQNLYTNLNGLIESSDDVVFSLDREYKYLFYNTKYLEMFDRFFEKKTIDLGLSIFDCITNINTPEMFRESLDKVFNGERYQGTSRYVDKDNNVAYFNVSMQPVYRDNTEIVAVSVFMKNVTQEYEISAKVAANEQLLNSITTNITEAVYRSSNKHGIVFANDAFYAMFGYRKGEKIIDADLYLLYESPGMRNIIMLELEKNGHISNRELLMRRRNGQTFWVLLNVSTTELDGQIYYDGVITNIDDRIKQDVIIRDNEERYRFLYDDNPSMYFTLDLNRTILSVNKFGAEQLGYKPEELTNSKYDLLYFAEDEQAFVHAFNAFIESKAQQTTCIFRKKTRFDTIIWVKESIRLVKNPAGETNVLVVCENINDQKRAEEELKISEESYRNLFEYASEAIYILNEEFLFEDVNATACEMYGYKKSEIIGKSPLFLSALNRNDKDYVFTLLSKALKGIPQEAEIWGKRKNGEIFPKKMRLQRGVYFGKTVIITFADDITNIKKSEEERTKLIADLTKQNRDLQHFSYVISHDLRAPVANMLSLTSIFSLDNIDQEIREKVIDGLGQSAKHLDRTIRDLNEVLSIRNDVHSIKEMVIFQDLVLGVEQALSKQIEQYDVSISYNFDEVNSIFTLRSYMQSIFFNLISNSIKYRDVNRKPEIEITTVQKSGKIKIIFKDNGLGLDLDKYKKKIFELYQRCHDHVDGRGLGLYLVKTQIEALNGVIDVDSEIGIGTTFTVILSNELS